MIKVCALTICLFHRSGNQSSEFRRQVAHGVPGQPACFTGPGRSRYRAADKTLQQLGAVGRCAHRHGPRRWQRTNQQISLTDLAAQMAVFGFAGLSLRNDGVVLRRFLDLWLLNCVNTLPHVVRLYDTYKDRRLVVVGIHTPEFPFEKSTDAVKAAIKRHAIQYPVAQDNEYATWNAYHNQYWPAQ